VNLPARAPNEVTNQEGGALRHLAAQLLQEDGVVVEVGSYRGRSMSFLADGAKAGEVPVYCVDPWTFADLTGPEVDQEDDNVEAAFLTALAANGHGLVTQLRGLSMDVLATWSRGPVGLLFIDGAHDTPSVRADLDGWTAHVPVGGTVVMHDMNYGPVYAAVAATLEAETDTWQLDGMTQRLKWYRRVAA